MLSPISLPSTAQLLRVIMALKLVELEFLLPPTLIWSLLAKRTVLVFKNYRGQSWKSQGLPRTEVILYIDYSEYVHYELAKKIMPSCREAHKGVKGVSGRKGLVILRSVSNRLINMQLVDIQVTFYNSLTSVHSRQRHIGSG